MLGNSKVAKYEFGNVLLRTPRKPRKLYERTSQQSHCGIAHLFHVERLRKLMVVLGLVINLHFKPAIEAIFLFFLKYIIASRRWHLYTPMAK